MIIELNEYDCCTNMYFYFISIFFAAAALPYIPYQSFAYTEDEEDGGGGGGEGGEFESYTTQAHFVCVINK